MRQDESETTKGRHVLKYLPGILLLQTVTVALVLLAPENLQGWDWLRLMIPLAVIGMVIAAWFNTLAAHQNQDEISRLQENHAKEREKLRVNAERAKTRIVKQAQKDTIHEVRRASSQANVKVGMAFAGAAGLGGLLLLTQFMTLGLFTLSAAGGALGGYVMRLRHEKGKPIFPRGDEVPRIINPSNRKKSTSTK